MEKNNQNKEKVIRRVTSAPAAAPRRERVAAYCRVSSGKDAMLHSLSAQVSHYGTYIQKHPGWEYAGVYADEACTGTKDTRPQFQKLLEECRAKRIDRILTKSMIVRKGQGKNDRQTVFRFKDGTEIPMTI